MGGGSVDDQDLLAVGPGWVALPTLHILAGAATPGTQLDARAFMAGTDG